MKEEEIRLETDESIIEYRTDIEGWVGVHDKKFYGSNKDLALYGNATHRTCSKGHDEIVYRKNSYCTICNQRIRDVRYNNRPEKEWDGTGFIGLCYDDQYFDSIEDAKEYAEEEGIDIKDLQLTICDEENHLREINLDSLFDFMLVPEGCELKDIVSKELMEKIEELNALIKKEGPISYSDGGTRPKLD